MLEAIDYTVIERLTGGYMHVFTAMAGCELVEYVHESDQDFLTSEQIDESIQALEDYYDDDI
jgi:hypothetical protein